MTTHLRALVVLGLVLIVPAACSSSSTKVRSRAGHPSPTTTSLPDTSSTVVGTTAVPATSPGPTSSAPPATAPTPIAVTTPGGPPPPAESGRGAIAGHVYAPCGGGNPNSGCQSQQGVAGDTITVKSGDTPVATTQTAADGSYRVEVPAGAYAVQEARSGGSSRVQVNAGQTVVADFSV